MRSTIVRYAEVVGVGRDAASFFLYGLEENATPISSWRDLADVADIVRHTFTASKYPVHEFYHLGLSDVDAEHGEVVSVDRMPGAKVKGGKLILYTGDVIFARIEPSIYNKKTAVVPDLGVCLGSTEFLVARPHYGVKPEYLLWALRTEWVAQQILGKMTGSTGRRRFEDADFAKLRIPWIEPDMQAHAVTILRAARNKYLRLLEDASQALREGEKCVGDFVASGSIEVMTTAEDELAAPTIQDRWANYDKLLLPVKTTNGQMTLDDLLDDQDSAEPSDETESKYYDDADDANDEV